MFYILWNAAESNLPAVNPVSFVGRIESLSVLIPSYTIIIDTRACQFIDSELVIMCDANLFRALRLSYIHDA